MPFVCATTWIIESTEEDEDTVIATVARASLSSMCSVTHFFRNCFFFLRQMAASVLRRAARK